MRATTRQHSLVELMEDLCYSEPVKPFCASVSPFLSEVQCQYFYSL